MSNFLDDKLFNHTIDRVIKSHDEMQQLINELILICETHWKEQVEIGITPKQEVKVLIDRSFNSWDLFVKRLVKEGWFFVDILKKYSYKNIFFENEELKNGYENLK